MTRALFTMSLSLMFALGCGEQPHPSDALSESGEALRATQQGDHGALTFDQPSPLTLSRSTPQHTFQFALTAPARVELRTLADATDRSVDTVLAITREGSSQALASNDDAGSSRFSRLVRELPAGVYRVLVRGFKRTTEGSFLFAASCSGAGCPSLEQSCLFGDTFYELRSEALLHVLDEHWIRSLDAIASQLEAQQLVVAVQQSSHTDVTTPAAALAAVDQSEVRRMRLRDDPSGREYDVFEYGAGDNSYGPIFQADSLMKAASIHDGDLLECTEW